MREWLHGDGWVLVSEEPVEVFDWVYPPVGKCGKFDKTPLHPSSSQANRGGSGFYGMFCLHLDVQPLMFHEQDLKHHFDTKKEALLDKLPSIHVMLGFLEVSIFSSEHYSSESSTQALWWPPFHLQHEGLTD